MTPAEPRDAAADRVVISHAQTRMTLRFALAFIAAAAIAAAAGGTRWLSLHLFLTGGVVLAISGVSLMLTVTWSTAPAPCNRWVIVQRTCIVVGTATVAVGREADLADVVVAIGAAAYLVGLLVLASLLVTTVRSGSKRRFDAAVGGYVCALAAGAAGVGIGIAMSVDGPTLALRSAHATANLLGLVGLVVGATMPFFAATVARSKMAPVAKPGRLATLTAWQATVTAVAIVAFVCGAEDVAAFALGGYALGVLVVLVVLPRLTRRQLTWAGPRIIALWAGGLWWSGAVAATAVDAASNRVVFGDRWLVVLVVAGYAQILWGSLAYLLPMLRGGGHERLGAGFATTRSWPGLAAVNVAGAAFAFDVTALGAAALALWVLDAAVRAAIVGVTRAQRPD